MDMGMNQPSPQALMRLARDCGVGVGYKYSLKTEGNVFLN